MARDRCERQGVDTARVGWSLGDGDDKENDSSDTGGQSRTEQDRAISVEVGSVDESLLQGQTGHVRSQ